MKVNIYLILFFLLFPVSSAFTESIDEDKAVRLMSNEATSVDTTVSGQGTKSNNEILAYADTARGGGIPGLEWQVSVESVLKKGKTENFMLDVSAISGSWVAEFTEPRNVFGNKLLKNGNNMWFTKRGLRRPVPISQRQRLTGSAANGDIASTNYVSDYEATRLDDEVIDGKMVYVFDLKAKNKSVTYDKVKYWVDQESGLGFRAEFYTSAGRLLKAATFQYDNRIILDDVEYPFISSMTIQDAINKTLQSKLNYTNIEIKSIPSAKFRI